MVTVEEHDGFVLLSAPATAPTVDNASPTPPAPAAPATTDADDAPAGSASEPSTVPPVAGATPVASQTEARTGVSVAWLFLIPVALAIFCVGVDIGSALEAHASMERERHAAEGGRILAAELSPEAEAEVPTRASSLAPTCGSHGEDETATDAWVGLEPLERELTDTRARAQAAELEAQELRAQLARLSARSSALVAHLNYTYAVSAKWEKIARAGIAAHNRWKARELQRKMLWRQVQMGTGGRVRAAGGRQLRAGGAQRQLLAQAAGGNLGPSKESPPPAPLQRHGDAEHAAQRAGPGPYILSPPPPPHQWRTQAEAEWRRVAEAAQEDAAGSKGRAAASHALTSAKSRALAATPASTNASGGKGPRFAAKPARGGRGRGKAGTAKSKKTAADARCAARECLSAPKQQQRGCRCPATSSDAPPVPAPTGPKSGVALMAVSGHS